MSTNFQKNVCRGLTKKKKGPTDWLTDWLTDWSKTINPSQLRCMGYNNGWIFWLLAATNFRDQDVGYPENNILENLLTARIICGNETLARELKSVYNISNLSIHPSIHPSGRHLLIYIFMYRLSSTILHSGYNLLQNTSILQLKIHVSSEMNGYTLPHPTPTQYTLRVILL